MLFKFFMAGYLAGVLFIAQLLGQAPVSPAATDNKELLRMQDFMECYLILIQVTRDVPYKEKVEHIYPKIIADYKDFIRRRPFSEFVDDAKLHIAEVHNWAAPRSDSVLFPDTAFDARWLEKANPWLLDVIENHPHDTQFDLVGGRDTGEPTAAMALYYYGTWNRDFSYLQRILDTYPETRPAGWVRERLKKIEADMQKKAGPSPAPPSP